MTFVQIKINMNFHRNETFKVQLLKRSILQWFLVGIFFAISQNKEVLQYFITPKTIIQILFFSIVGGLFFFWITNKFVGNKRNNKL
jgi:hypothetical protein